MPAALLSLAIYLSASIFGRRLWGAVQEKNNNFFCAQNIFLMQHHLAFVDMKYFFVLHQLYFCWYEILFRATSTHFFRNQITFCAASNFLFQHKIIFRATPNFCFGHRLGCYVMAIYFYCHIATKIWSRVTKQINFHFYVTRKN